MRVLAVLVGSLGALVHCQPADEAPPTGSASSQLVLERFPSTRSDATGVDEWDLAVLRTEHGDGFLVARGYAIVDGARTAILELSARDGAAEATHAADPRSGETVILGGARAQALADDFRAMAAGLGASPSLGARSRPRSIGVRADSASCDGPDASGQLVATCPTQLVDCAQVLTTCGDASSRAAGAANAVSERLASDGTSASRPPASVTLGAGAPALDRRCIAAPPTAAGTSGAFAEALSALQSGDRSAFEQALGRTADLDAEDSLGLTLAMHAAALGRVDALEALARRNADIARSNPRTGATILHLAAQAATGSVEVARFMRARMGDARFVAALNTRIRSNNHTVAMEAVFNINEPLVRELLALRAELREIDLATTAVTGWGPQTFAFRERYAFAADLPPSAVTVPELADFLAGRGALTREAVLARINEERNRWGAEQDAAFLGSASEAERANQAAGQELLRSIAAARGGSLSLEELEAQVNANRAIVNGTFGRMGATLLSAVPVPGMTAEQLARAERIQEILMRAGADPNLAETGLMLVPAGFRESVFGYSSMVDRYLGGVCGDQRARFLDVQGPLNGYTKLIDAALRGQRAVICSLVAAGADRSVAAINGLTARGAAERFNATASDPASRLPQGVLDVLEPTSTALCP